MLQKLRFALVAASYLYAGYIIVDGLIFTAKEIIEYNREKKSKKVEQERINKEFSDLVQSI